MVLRRLGRLAVPVLLLTSCLPWLGGTLGGGLLPLRYEVEIVDVDGLPAARLTVANPGRRAVAIRFSSSQRYDFVVRQGNTEIWRWSRGRAFLTVVVEDRLEPGESVAFTEALPRLPAGAYALEAFFLADRPAVAVARTAWAIH